MNEYTFKCPHCGCVHNAGEYLDMDRGLLDGELERDSNTIEQGES